jgi:hypothetical protein
MSVTTTPINYGDPIYITNGLNVLSGTLSCGGIWPSMSSPTFLPYSTFIPYGTVVPDVFVIYGPNGVLPPAGTPVSYGDQVTILTNKGTFWKQLHDVCLMSTDSGSPTPFVLSGNTTGPIQAQAWGTSITSASNSVIVIQDAPGSGKNGYPLWADNGYNPLALAVTTGGASQTPAVLTFWSVPASIEPSTLPFTTTYFDSPIPQLFLLQALHHQKSGYKWQKWSKITFLALGLTILGVGYFGGSKAAKLLATVIFILYFVPNLIN